MPDTQLWSKYRRLWSLLPPPFDWAAAALVAGSIVGTLLEVLAIASLGVLMGELGSMGVGASQQWLPLPEFLGEAQDSNHRIRLILLACAGVFLLKNAFLAAHAWLEATFAFRLQAWLSQRMVDESLRLDYEDATKRSPSEYTALLTADLGSLVYFTLLPALTLLSEVALVAAMFLYLVWVQPSVTLVVAIVLLVAGAVIVRASRTMVTRLGLRRQALEDARVRLLQQTFGNLRDIYIYGAGRHLHGQLASVMAEIATVYRGYQMMSTGPRFLLEFAMVAILLAMVAVGLGSQDRGVLVATVGVFAASGFRFLIGANRLIMSLQSLRFGDAAFSRVWEATRLTLKKDKSAQAQASGDAGGWVELRAEDLVYRHAGSPTAVGPVDLRVRRGEMVGLVGTSGVGKSTILELLAGLRHPHGGGVVVVDAHGDSARSVGPSPRITLVGQTTAVLSSSLRENVVFGLEAGAVADSEVWQALRLAQLEEFARSLPEQLDTPLAEYGTSLSGGQLQRIGIARALLRHSSFLLLDEPTSALDPATEAELVRTLRALTDRCGIVMVSHRKAPLHLCDHVYALHRGGVTIVRNNAVDLTA